jgi:hypothetical protein
MELPMWKKSRADSELPSLAPPYMLIAEPSLESPRILQLLPNWTQSKTLIADPNLLMP